MGSDWMRAECMCNQGGVSGILGSNFKKQMFCPIVMDTPNILKSLQLQQGIESERESHSVVFNSLQLHEPYSPWNSPGLKTGVGSLSLLQGIFPTRGLNPGLPHYGQILYHLSHKGSPRILEWVAYPFSSGSSQPRNQTRVSCITGGFFTN